MFLTGIDSEYFQKKLENDSTWAKRSDVLHRDFAIALWKVESKAAAVSNEEQDDNSESDTVELILEPDTKSEENESNNRESTFSTTESDTSPTHSGNEQNENLNSIEQQKEDNSKNGTALSFSTSFIFATEQLFHQRDTKHQSYELSESSNSLVESIQEHLLGWLELLPEWLKEQVTLSSPIQSILRLIDSLQKQQDNYKQGTLQQNLSLSVEDKFETDQAKQDKEDETTNKEDIAYGSDIISEGLVEKNLTLPDKSFFDQKMIVKATTELSYLESLQKNSEVSLHITPLIGLISIADFTSSANNIDILGNQGFPIAIDEI
jgi:hypothetical protein